MKPMAYTRHKYSGELYKFVRKATGTTNQIEYYFVGLISLTAGVDKVGRMTIRMEEPLPVGSLIANIRDTDNQLILDDIVWQITNIEPILNAFNNIESYRLRAVQFQGTL